MISTTEAGGVTSTFTGSINSILASCFISGGMVAEKKSDCFFAGNLLMIFLTSSTKPCQACGRPHPKQNILDAAKQCGAGSLDQANDRVSQPKCLRHVVRRPPD